MKIISNKKSLEDMRNLVADFSPSFGLTLQLLAQNQSTLQSRVNQLPKL